MEEKTKIVIAEDENIIAKDIMKTLKRLGYEVLGSARTGEEIISKTRELKPDLVLMDIVLEGMMSGIEAAEKIMTGLDIPVIYLTALADNETLHRAKITEPFGYVLNPFDERILYSAIEMAMYKHKINRQLKERTRELEEERSKSNQLLHNILPANIVREWKEKGFIKPREFSLVTLLVTDFQEFTSISSKLHPQQLVNELNDIFKNFDAIIAANGLEKLKTMGDSYFVGGGLPSPSEDHAELVINAALEMQEFLMKRNVDSEYKWEMRAGVHSGNVIAGVVGKNKFTYDVWGNTVNIANKMERLGVAGKVNITENTYNLVKDLFECEYRGSAEITGGGTIKMYTVSCRKKEPESWALR